MKFGKIPMKKKNGFNVNYGKKHLRNSLHFLYNIDWPLLHQILTASKYLIIKKSQSETIGGYNRTAFNISA